MDITQLEKKTLGDLRQLARDHDIAGFSRLKKQELILVLLHRNAESRGYKLRGGILEVVDDGMGFLRSNNFLRNDNFLSNTKDIYVSQTQIKRFSMRTGDMVIGQVRPPKDSEKYYGCYALKPLMGCHRMRLRIVPTLKLSPLSFQKTASFWKPNRKILSTRLIDLIAPIGKGQRGLIVSPPKAGKTTVLKEVANAISQNYPEVHLMICLVGERPEEVTDIDRSVEAEVIASTFDEPVEHHVHVAEMALNRAKRLVEVNHDVVLLLDSITRLARAYNLVVPSSGRTLSGGLDPSAIHPPKRLYGAARNIENGSSLTIIATCLVNTGSKMDDVIYEEFKGTGNMELHLSRKLQERRIFPTFDIEQSATRREELLLGPDVVQRVYTMRRMISYLSEQSELGLVGAWEQVLNQFRQTETNEEFLNQLSGRSDF